MTRIIRREDAHTLRQVQALLETAELECLRLRDEADVKARQEGQQGEAVGLRAVRREQAGEVFRALMDRDAYLAGAQAQVVGVVVNAVRRIVPDFDGRGEVTQAVADALARTRAASRARVRLSPEDVPGWQERLAQSRLASIIAPMVDVMPDAGLASGDAQLESPLGTLVCDPAGLLRAMERAAGDMHASPMAVR